MNSDNNEENSQVKQELPPKEALQQASRRMEQFMENYKMTDEDRVELTQISTMSATSGITSALGAATAIYGWRYANNRLMYKPLLPLMAATTVCYAVGGAVGALLGFRSYLATSQSPLCREYLRYLHTRKELGGMHIPLLGLDKLPRPSDKESEFASDEEAEKLSDQAWHSNATGQDGQVSKSSSPRHSKWDEIRERVQIEGLGSAQPGRVTEDQMDDSFEITTPVRKLGKVLKSHVQKELNTDIETGDEEVPLADDQPNSRKKKVNKYGDPIE